MADAPMCSARVVDGGLRTAVQEYRHENGRSILLIGCVHIARLRYYEELRAIAEQAESSGATVYIESVQDGEGLATASKYELDAITVMREAVNTQYIGLTQVLDLPWVYQKQSTLAPYPETWRSSDVAAIDMVRLVGPENVTALSPSLSKVEQYRQMKETKGAESQSFQIAREIWATKYIYAHKSNWTTRTWAHTVGLIIRGVSRIVIPAVRMALRRPKLTDHAWMLPFIHTYRESIAALRALEASADAVLIWHPDHMVGIGQILARNGFEAQEPRQWLTACHKADIALENDTAKKTKE
jgi:hypothetical protein